MKWSWTVAACVVAGAAVAGSSSVRLGKAKEIYLAGGCFWGMEHYFKQMAGVLDTEVGYANGTTENPTY